MEVTTQTLAGINTSFQSIFNNAFAGAPTDHSKVAMDVPSTGAKNAYPWLSQLPQMREWIGDRVVHSLKTHGYEIENKKFELTVEVSRDTIDDDSVGTYTPLVGEFGRSSAEHPSKLVFALLASGTSRLAYDGQYFFDTDHPVLDADGAEVSVSNYGGGAGTPWYLLDMSRMVKPIIFQKRRDYALRAKTDLNSDRVFDADMFTWGVDARVNAGFGLWQLAYCSQQPLNAENYAAARAAMSGMKGDFGHPLGVRPTLLVVPPSLEQDGNEVIKAERLANGQTNVNRNTAELLMTPWLAA